MNDSQFSSLFHITYDIFPFSVPDKMPDCCKRNVAMPTLDEYGNQYIYYIDYQSESVTRWVVNMDSLIDSYISYLDRQGYEVTRKLQAGRLSLHTAEIYGDSIYLFPIYGNFFLIFNIHSRGHQVVYEDFRFIYSASNHFINNQVYLSRWDILESFQREDKDTDIQVDLLCYELSTRRTQVIQSLKGPDCIHQTMLLEQKNMIVINETSKLVSPVADPGENDVQAAMQQSRVMVYDVSRDTTQTIYLDKGPAHIVAGGDESDTLYITCCNLSTWGCHGPGTLEKFHVSDQLCRTGSYTAPDFFRIPAHAHYEFNGVRYICVSVYNNQIYLLNADTMALEKRIYLSSKNAIRPILHDGFYFYSKLDRSPYSILPIDGTPYMVLAGTWAVSVLDVEKETVVSSFSFNKLHDPIKGCGHSSFML